MAIELLRPANDRDTMEDRVRIYFEMHQYNNGLMQKISSLREKIEMETRQLDELVSASQAQEHINRTTRISIENEMSDVCSEYIRVTKHLILMYEEYFTSRLSPYLLELRDASSSRTEVSALLNRHHVEMCFYLENGSIVTHILPFSLMELSHYEIVQNVLSSFAQQHLIPKEWVDFIVLYYKENGWFPSKKLDEFIESQPPTEEDELSKRNNQIEALQAQIVDLQKNIERLRSQA